MRRSAAVLGTTVFFVLVPGTLAGLIPWLWTHWESDAPAVARIAGAILIAAGLVPLVGAFVEFARAGGTPAPTAPTERLVVGGFNRYVRNPMYVGVLATIVGQALLFGHVGLLLYGAAFWAVTATFVRLYEEPTLVRQYGAEYEVYRRSVRAWLPRLHAWQHGRG